MTYWSGLAIFFFATATTVTVSSHLGDHRTAMLHHLTLWTVNESRTQYNISTHKVAILNTVQEVERRLLLWNVFYGILSETSGLPFDRIDLRK